MTHCQQVQFAFSRACEVLGQHGFQFKPMNRRAAIKSLKKSYTLGHINFKNKTITVDIYTPRRRRPKKMSAILRVIAHELAHHQRPPYRQRWRGRIINRIHYPRFYKQVNQNIKRLKKDKVLRKYF